jgi:hypothetical protein
MTTILPTTRLRLYDVPHKALRNIMAQVSQLAGNTDYRYLEQIERLHALASRLFRLLTEHAHDENNYTLADLEAREPGSGQHNLDDHEEIEYQQANLERLLDELRAAAYRGADVRPLGDVFFRAFNRFQSAYLLHMLEEEEVTQPRYWKNFTDGDIIQLRRRITSNIKPQTMLLWIEYALPALPHTDRVGLLRSIRAGAPPSFFGQAMNIAARVLPKAELAKVEAEVEEVAFA